MLDSFRKVSQTWVAKIFFGLLVLTFVGWGIGDVFRARITNQPAITIGGTKIAPDTVVEDFRHDADRLREMSGGKIGIDQARQMGFLQQTVQRLITQGLLDEEASRMGLTVDDGAVRQAIAQIPAFRNQLNAFDAQQYARILQANGLNEQRFEARQRQDMVRGELSRMVISGVGVPDALVDPIFKFRDEKRVAEIITFDANKMPAPAAPADSVLQDYYKAHNDKFMAPEERALTVVLARGSDLVGDYKPGEDLINKTYQDRQADYTTDETRDLKQVFFDDQAGAQSLADAVKKGSSFEDAAKAANKTVDDLGEVGRKSLPLDTVANAAFSAEVPGVAGPVQTPLGWNVLYIADKHAGSVKPLADVRDKIVADLVKDETINRLNALSTKLEDAAGSGSSPEDIASSLGLKLVKVAAVDSKGAGPDGKPVADLPESAALREVAFGLAKGATSEVGSLENDTGYFLVRADNVTPPALKPFDAAKDAVLAAWALDQKRDAAKLAAIAAAQKLQSGQGLAAVAGATPSATTAPFSRAGNKDVSPTTASAVFKLAAGQATTVLVGDLAQAARLKTIVPADPKADGQAYAQLRDQLERSIGDDLSAQYVVALHNQIGVQVNTAAINQQFGNGQ